MRVASFCGRRRGDWHVGLVARWWAEFNVEAPELDLFRPIVESGQSALDLACGTGRLLAPRTATSRRRRPGSSRSTCPSST